MRARMRTAAAATFLTLSSSIWAQEIENFTGSLQIVNGKGTYSGTSGGGGGGGGHWGGSSGGSGTAAVQAECPAHFPVSCTNIQQPNYCCPSNNYCSWTNSIVACCPNGKTCSGYAQPTSTYYQPTTVYQQNPTNVVVVGGAAATTNYQQPQTTVTQDYAGQYCRTLVAVGPGLPTTQAGDCGTILIVEADAVRAAVMSWVRAIGMVVGLQVMGGVALMRR